MARGEDSAGVCLEILLKLRGPLPLSKRHRHAELPWAMLCGVITLARVVATHTIVQVVRQSGVVTGRIAFTLEYIDTRMTVHLACPGVVRSAARLARLRVSPKLDNFAEAGFVLRCAADEAWRRGESNPRPEWICHSFYARVLSLSLATLTADKQAINAASHHVNMIQRPGHSALRKTCCRRLTPPSRYRWRDVTA